MSGIKFNEGEKGNTGLRVTIETQERGKEGLTGAYHWGQEEDGHGVA